MVGSPTQGRTGPYTVADYDGLPDDGPRYELVDGVLIEMPSPGALHQMVQYYLASLLLTFVMSRGLGRVAGSPLDIRLGDEILQPDIVYISNQRAHIRVGNRIVGAPDLAVELLSPSTRDYDLTTKRERYRRAGVREYWVVDLEARAATVWALVGDRYVERQPDADGIHASAVLPGFAVDVAAVIAAVE